MPAETDHVAANYRYIAAYNEVTARIGQRQQALTLYVSLVVGLLAALVATRGIGGGDGGYAQWLLYGFPVASACLTFLNFKYEQIITNLRRFLSELEKLNNPGLVLPSYNTHPEWARRANLGRRFHDYACAILVAVGNFAALGAYFSLYGRKFNAVVWVVIAVAVAAIGAHLLISRLSYRAE